MIIHLWLNCSSVTKQFPVSKPLICNHTVHLWPNISPVTKPFIHDQTIHWWPHREKKTLWLPWPNHSPMNKPFTHDQTIHPLPNCSSITKPFDHDQTSIHRFNVIWLILVVENLSFVYPCVVFRWPSVLLVPLVGCHLWLWHFLRTRYHYGTIWGLSMIVALPGDFLYDTSWESMIVALPGDSLWLWHFLGTHSDCGTSWGLLWLWYFLGTLWLWHFLRTRYDCGMSRELHDCGTS